MAKPSGVDKSVRGPEGREEVLGHVRKVQTGMRKPPVDPPGLSGPGFDPSPGPTRAAVPHHVTVAR